MVKGKMGLVALRFAALGNSHDNLPKHLPINGGEQDLQLEVIVSIFKDSRQFDMKAIPLT